ncbi:MAG: N-acetyltransferase [Spirochaetaceae bacterium]
MIINVRLEEEQDYKKVEDITREAFSYPGRIERGGIGCPYEHWMVHEFRNKDGIKELSYVSEVDNSIIGHIIFTKAYILTSNDRKIDVLTFGPFSVLPKYQRKGVGKLLMNTTIKKATELGYGAIVFFGRPEYYPQFGFVEAAKYSISDRNGDNYPAIMAMELIEGYLTGNNSRFFESDIYDDNLNKESVIKFDKLIYNNT